MDQGMAREPMGRSERYLARYNQTITTENKMKVEFKVHGIAKGTANVKTEVDGEALTASVPCVEVELVTVSERSGSLTLRFVGSAMEEAVAKFTPDSVHIWDV
jgi:hypothetical protein